MLFRCALQKSGSQTSKRITALRNLRCQSLALMAALQARKGYWLICRGLHVKLLLARILERRALRDVMRAAPSSENDALEKLRYGIAFIIVDGGGIGRREVDKLVDTLQPFQAEVKRWLLLSGGARAPDSDELQNCESVAADDLEQ